MSAAQRKTPYEDMAGSYAPQQVAPRAIAPTPTINDVKRRDFATEALRAVEFAGTLVAHDGELELPSVFRAQKYRQVGQPAFPSRASETAPHRVEGPPEERKKVPEARVAPDRAQGYFMSTQEWDGYVTQVCKDHFEGVMYPAGHGAERREDLISVPLSLIGDESLSRVRPGAIFRLATGRLRRKKQVMHGVKVYFRPEIPPERRVTFEGAAFDTFLDN